MDKSGIKNIIFDLGGVLLNIDYNKAVDAFYDLGIDKENLEYSQAEQARIFDGLETGKLSPKEFRDELRQLSYLGLSDKEIDAAWNSLILDMPQYRIQLIEKLKIKYNIYLLSNTNIIHYKDYNEVLKKENGLNGLESLFVKTYLSHEIGMRKPDVSTFEWVCKDANIIPSETLFIDDSEQHINGAKKAGLNAYWLHNEDIVECFPEEGVKKS